MASKQPLGNMIINLDLNSSAFNKGLTGAKKAVTSSMRAMRAEMKIMSASGNQMGVLQAKRRGLTKTLEAQKEEIRRLEKAYNQSFDSQGNATQATAVYADKLNSARAQAASLEAQISKTDKEMQKLSKQKAIDASAFTKLGKQLDVAGDKIKKVSKSIKDVGKTMTKSVTVPIMAGFGASLKAAVDYEQALAGVQKTTDLSGKEMKKMSKEITDMSNKMPFAATEVAGVAEAAGQLGVKKEDITGFTKTMLDMSVATNLTADEAATEFARFANAAGMPMKNVDRLGATVVNLGNNTATTEKEIVEMGQRLAGAGSQAGFSADQIMSIAAAMSSVGIRSEAGGSAMTQIFNKMTKAAANGGDELAGFAKTAGMSAEEFASTWESNPTKALSAFVKGLGETKGGASGVVAALEEVGIKGIREADTIRRLANNHKVLDDALKTGKKGWEDNTALTKEAEIRYETLGSKLQVLKNNLVNLGREIGATMAPYVEVLTDKLTALIKKFQGMSWHSKQMIVIFGLIAAAIGPLLVVIGQIGIGIGTLAKGFGKINKGLGILSGSIKNAGGLLAWLKAGFGAINWPITLTIAAIVGVTTGLVALYKKSETFRNIVNSAVEAVKNKFLQFKEVVSSLFSLFTGGINFEEFKQQLNGVVGESTIQRFQAVHDFIGRITGAFQAMGAVLTEGAGFAQLKETFGNVFSDEALQRILTIGEAIRGFVEMAKEKFAELSEMITQAFQGNFEPLLQFIEQLIPKIVMMLIGGLPALLYTGFSLITKLAEGMGISVPQLLEKVTTIITTMLTKFSEMLPYLVQQGIKIIASINNGILMFLPKLITMATDIITTLVNALGNLLPVIIYAGISILTSLITGIINSLPKIVDTSVKMITILANSLTNLLPKIINSGFKILAALIKGILQILPKLAEAALTIILKIVSSLISNLPKIISAGIKILKALIQGVLKILPQLAIAALKIIITLAAAILKNAPKILAAGFKLLVALGKGLLQALPELMSMLPEIFNSIIDGFKSVDWKGLGKDILNGILKGLKDIGSSVWDSVKDVGNSIKDGFKDFFGIHSPSRVMADLAKFLPEGIAKGITDNKDVVVQAMQMLNGILKDTVQPTAEVGVDANANDEDKKKQTLDVDLNPLQNLMSGFSEQIPQVQSLVNQFITTINQSFYANNVVMKKLGVTWLTNFLQGLNAVYPQIIQRVTQLINQANTVIKNNYSPMYNQGRALIQRLLNGFNSLYAAMVNRVKQLIRQINTLLINNYSPMYNQGRTWLQRFLNGFNSLYAQMINRIKQLISQINSLITKNNTPMYNQGRTWLQKLRDGFNSLYSSFISLVNRLCSEAVSKIRGKHGDFYNAGKYLINGLKDGIAAMKGPIGSIMNDVANKMIGGIANGVSGVRSGVNHILKEVGSDKKIAKWEVPKYAKGTKGHPEDGLAIINDQKGPNYREIVQNPGEKPVMYKDRNVMVPLKKGASVIKASVAKKMTKGKSIPHYKDGTDDTDVFDLVDDKKKFSKFIKGKINLDSVGEPWKDMSKKASKMMIDAAYDMVEEEAGAMVGDFDGKMGPHGVYQYLWDVAKKVMKKFPGMVYTSGYRPGDPHHHGKHQAVDIAYPTSDNGSSKYFAPANYAFNKFRDQIAYVITQAKVKDRVGSSGQKADSKWHHWPDNDHWDHLHLSGRYGPGDVGKGGGDSFSGGSGVGRWKKTAIRALRMTGQYSQRNLNLLMNQMKSESNGNPRAINNWDSNARRGTPSKGLMQVIDPTFQSNKYPGHNNIYNPLDNILAAIRYTLKQYGSLAAGWRGVGYENGGLVTRHQIAQIGEGNKPEMVLPLTNKARSLQLMGQAMQIMGMDSKGATSANSYDDADLIALLIEQHKETVKVLKAIAAKDTSVDADGLTDYANDKLGRQLRRLVPN